MKKLSEIKDDEYICVGSVEHLMTNEDYLEDPLSYGEDVKLYETVKTYGKINIDSIESILEDISENDMYEDWFDDVKEEVKNCVEWKLAVEAINAIFQDYPTYYERELIENDCVNAIV